MKSIALSDSPESAISMPATHSRAYAEYRPTTVWGLVALPSHWREKPLKRVARINADKLTDATDPDHEIDYVDIGNVSLEKGITSTERLRFEAAPSRARRLVREGDTIVSTVRTYLKAVAQITRQPENLVVSTGFAVVHATSELDPGYLYRLIQSEAFVGRIMAHSVGVSYPAINASDIGAFQVQLPPLEEQQLIANYLHHKTAQIDELIGRMRQLQVLLGEKRLSMISDFVQHGTTRAKSVRQLEPAWLGTSPSHWQTRIKLKSLALPVSNSFTNGPFGSDLLTSELRDEGVPVIYIRDLNKEGYARSSTSHVTNEKALQLDKFRVDTDDILIAKVGDPPGFACVYPSTEPPGVVCQDVIRLKPDTAKVSPFFLCYFLNSRLGVSLIDSICVELTRKRFSLADLQSLRIPLPPRMEQDQIVSALDQAVRRFDELSSHVEDGLLRINQYRSALISSAVTGQIDIRNYRPEAPCQ